MVPVRRAWKRVLNSSGVPSFHSFGLKRLKKGVGSELLVAPMMDFGSLRCPDRWMRRIREGALSHTVCLVLRALAALEMSNMPSL